MVGGGLLKDAMLMSANSRIIIATPLVVEVINTDFKFELVVKI